MQKRALLALALPLLLGSCNQAYLRGCESSCTTPNIAALEADLSAAKARWAQAGITNYTYTSTSSMSMAGQVSATVVVRNSVVQSPTGALTTEQQFSGVKTLIDEAKAANSCTVAEAKYDATDGHLLSLSWSNLKQGLMDAFGSVSITAFQRD